MTLADRLTAMIAPLEDGCAVTLPVSVVRAWLAEVPSTLPAPLSPTLEAATDALGWRTRLWTCHPETRLGVREVAEALDRSPDWVYRATSKQHAERHGRTPLPCTRLDGVLCYTAAEIRRWLESAAVTVNPAPAALRPQRQLSALPRK